LNAHATDVLTKFQSTCGTAGTIRLPQRHSENAICHSRRLFQEMEGVDLIEALLRGRGQLGSDSARAQIR
jgi:hypothetical protein